MANQPLTTLFPVTHTTNLDPVFLGGLIRELQSRLASLEILRDGLEGAIAVAQDTAITRVNDLVAPAQDELSAKLAEADASLVLVQQLLSELEEGVAPIGVVTTFTATEGQTDFSVLYSNGAGVEVFLNGINLVRGQDFTTPGSGSVVLSYGATEGDIFKAIVRGGHEVVDTYTTAQIDADIEEAVEVSAMSARMRTIWIGG